MRIKNDASPLPGVVALITGASRGIGRAAALELARAGADVVLAARSTDAHPSRLPGTIDAVAREVRALGRRALAVTADVTRADDVRAMTEGALTEFGRVDLLVNNAAYFYRAPLRETPAEKWDQVMDVNLRGALICTRAVLTAMTEQGSGRIINMSSALAEAPAPNMLSYAASKAALEAVTRGLAAELESCAIAVNALRIDRPVATEGALFLNPGADYSGWEKPGAVGRAVVWLATRPLSYTGNVAPLSDICELMVVGGSAGDNA
jgi:NAD(P)-dependent dehydrogenase (short-subunit alcohol dehydrogenase family)